MVDRLAGFEIGAEAAAGPGRNGVGAEHRNREDRIVGAYTCGAVLRKPRRRQRPRIKAHSGIKQFANTMHVFQFSALGRHS